MSDRSSLRFRWSHKSWPLLVVLAFGAVFCGALTMEYVEGDDATSIVYHALGRNSDLQSPYAVYQAGADLLMRPLPASEPLLRISAILGSATASVVFVLLALQLAFRSDQGEEAAPSRALVTCALLLATPELFYFGLYYSPAILGLCFVTAAHLVARGARESGSRAAARPAAIGLSVALFAAGVALRWPLLGYGGVIAADLWLGISASKRRGSMRSALLWGASALGAGLAVIVIAGASSGRIPWGSVGFVAGQRGAARGGLFEIETALSLSPFITPAFLLLLAAGLTTSHAGRLRTLALLAAGLLGAAPFLLTGVPKFIAPALVPLMLCAARGFRALWTGSAWGPGFQIRPFDRSASDDATRVGLAIGGGAAFPTPEGPRPVGGHAFVLLGGGWRSFVTSQAEERRRLVARSIESELPILTARWSPDFFAAELLRRGFTTQEPADGRFDDRFDFIGRRFTDTRGRHVELLERGVTGPLSDDDWIALARTAKVHPRVLFHAASSTLRSLWKRAPTAVEGMGSHSALVDLEGIGAPSI